MKGEAEVAGKPQRPERAFWEVWARPQATCLVNSVPVDVETAKTTWTAGVRHCVF